ncbi:MAG: Ppx/GppA family phosphatase, partial [Pseudomonadota bacterium]
MTDTDPPDRGAPNALGTAWPTEARSSGSALAPAPHPTSGSATHSPPVGSDKTDQGRSKSFRRSHQDEAQANAEPVPIYAALDLGTNNCRLLIAKPSRRGFVVVDSFSRIIRLGEGLSQTGALSPAAMSRTIDALRVCANKMRRMEVARARLVATQACRLATNGAEFLERVKREVGLELEILSREAEARLAVAGCGSLIDPDADHTLVFDIGGGSSELAWIDVRGAIDPTVPPLAGSGPLKSARLHAWTSLPFGVVTLAEQFNGRDVSEASFEAMVASVAEQLKPFEASAQMTRRLDGRRIHFLGTSG